MFHRFSTNRTTIFRRSQLTITVRTYTLMSTRKKYDIRCNCQTNNTISRVKYSYSRQIGRWIQNGICFSRRHSNNIFPFNCIKVARAQCSQGYILIVDPIVCIGLSNIFGKPAIVIIVIYIGINMIFSINETMEFNTQFRFFFYAF